MTAARWSGQDTYAALIESTAAANGVPRELAYGLIAQESGFNPQAVRSEPQYHCAATGQTGDASYGLMQVLYCTALGLGYTGPASGLFDPASNLSLGMLLLGRLLASHGGDTGAALSAYNGGDRPSLGYGARRADGTFANQAYVDNVTNNAAYFATYLAERDAAGGGDTTDAGSGVNDFGAGTGDSGVSGTATAIGVGFLLAAAAYALARVLRH